MIFIALVSQFVVYRFFQYTKNDFFLQEKNVCSAIGFRSLGTRCDLRDLMSRADSLLC